MKSTLAFLLLSVVAVGCGASADDKIPKVVLGAVIDQTGNNSELSWIQAIQLAIENVNDALDAEGHWKNFHFSVDLQDSQNDVDGGASSVAIQRLTKVFADGAKAAVIDTTQISEEANKPQYAWGYPLQCSSCTGGAFLNPASTDPDPQLQASRQNLDRWMSRTGMATGALATIIAHMIAGSEREGDLNHDGHLKVEAFGSNEAYGQATTTAVINALGKAFPDKAGQPDWLTTERWLHPNVADYRQIDYPTFIAEMVNNVNETTGATDYYPDFIVVSTFAKNDAGFVEEFKSEGIKGIKVIHLHTFRFSSNLLALGELGEGEEGVSHVLLDGPTGTTFAQAFHDKFQLTPEYRDSTYYDNAITLMLAMLMAMVDIDDPNTVDGEKIRDSLPCTSATAARLVTDRPLVQCPKGPTVQVGPGADGMKTALNAIIAGLPIDYTGASGPVDYDSEGNVKDKATRYKIQNGAFVDFATFDCITDITNCPCNPNDGFSICPGQETFCEDDPDLCKDPGQP